MSPPPPVRQDHIQLGRQLDIFTTDPLVGAGLPLWLPAGAAVRYELEQFILELERRAGYEHVVTPAVAKQELYARSGHWEYYAQDMFPPMETGEAGERLVLRPVNCPHHILVYRHADRSYRDLPLRLAELGDMYRMERSGVVSGLSRVRAMTLNDGHVFCRPAQVGEEVAAILDLVDASYDRLGLVVSEVRLSTRDEASDKWAGDSEQWRSSEAALRAVLGARDGAWTETPGDAAFYGPKVDIDVADVHGRAFTLSTVQVDLWMPDRFDLRYVDEEGARQRPVMVHRSILSTAERLMAFLLERTQGRFPYWLAPEQVHLLPVSDTHAQAAREVAASLRCAGVRSEVVPASRSLGSRVRRAADRMVPVTAVLGDREVEAGQVSVRLRGSRDAVSVTLPALQGALEGAGRDRLQMPVL
ncbi:threonine--tRNA ligase [Euzebya tangerina]|uniref:threonine--tRNA ligase n=1 Tax=Euzebya tangerina TaxID=591198 RepID=UPI000E31D582|nr:threonine--tRNA ligase [Euzebya tangerina]